MQFFSFDVVQGVRMDSPVMTIICEKVNKQVHRHGREITMLIVLL